jgi:hypothetical protein
MDNSELIPWIERLGGWGVVILVVRWQMTRMDRMLDGLDKSVSMFAESLSTFQEFERESRRVHDIIVSTQREILEAIKESRS